jgi:tryptophan synthase beta chain
MTLQFESETTIRYQIQEMLRIEKIFEEEGIVQEIEAYAPLMPDGSNWKATMLLEYPDIHERKRELARLIGVEAAGEGLESGRHSASLQKGAPGVLHGNRTYILQDNNGQITETHSISAGLDYPGVGPEHAFLKDIGRAEYVGITDQEALDAFHYLCRTEGIIPALESSHAVAHAMKLAKTMTPQQSILVNLSGRGDKDIGTVADLSNADFFCRPSCQGQSIKGAGVVHGEQVVSLSNLQGAKA